MLFAAPHHFANDLISMKRRTESSFFRFAYSVFIRKQLFFAFGYRVQRQTKFLLSLKCSTKVLFNFLFKVQFVRELKPIFHNVR